MDKIEITTARVETLMAEAAAAGDVRTVRDSERVLDGRRAGAATRRIARVLADAQARVRRHLAIKP